jgi:uncharacterized protein (AIM24 family)
MKLITDIFAWILGKFLIFIVILLVVTVSAFLWNLLEQQLNFEGDVDKLRKQLVAIENELKTININLENKKSIIDRRKVDIEKMQDSLPNPILNPGEYYLQKKRIGLEKDALQGFENAYEEIKKSHAAVQARINQKLQEIQVSEGKISKTYIAIKESLYNYQERAIFIFILIMIGPFAWKSFWYFVVAAKTSDRNPLIIQKQRQGQCVCRCSGKTLKVKLNPGENIIIRSDWIQQYSNESYHKETVFVFDKRSVFTCYAAGLVEMVKLISRTDKDANSVVIGSVADSQGYIAEIKLENDAYLVVKPSHIVGIIGNIRIRTKWNLSNVHSWISGTLRHILVHGEGSVFITGNGGISIGDTQCNLREPLLICYEASLRYSTTRTEAFWSFYRQKSALFDIHFAGDGLVLCQSSVRNRIAEEKNIFIRVVDAVLVSIGKVLGF